MTKSTQRARDASKPKSAVRQRTKKTRTSESAKGKDGIFVKIDVTPEQFFQAWSRKEREALIELLIDSLDEIDGDPDREEGGDDEPVLAAPENHATVPLDSGLWRSGQRRDESGDQSDWAQGAWNDCEGDGCADDREDVCEDEGAEHDGREPDVDLEYSLGWHNESAQRGGGWFNPTTADYEQCVPIVTEAARQRYKPFDRYSSHGNRDGKHVDSARGYGRASRRLTNLSDQQRAAVALRINRDEVRI